VPTSTVPAPRLAPSSAGARAVSRTLARSCPELGAQQGPSTLRRQGRRARERRLL